MFYLNCKDNNNLLIEYKPHKQIDKLANRQIDKLANRQIGKLE